MALGEAAEIAGPAGPGALSKGRIRRPVAEAGGLHVARTLRLAGDVARVRHAEVTVNATYQEGLNAARNVWRCCAVSLMVCALSLTACATKTQMAARRLAADRPSASRDYAIHLNAVCDDCREAYGDMAAKAAGHSVNVRTFRSAWPVIPSWSVAGK